MTVLNFVMYLCLIDEEIDAFQQYNNEVENQLNLKIKMIRSDRGGEYESPFAEICLEYGIFHQTTAPYTPQSNGFGRTEEQNIKGNDECLNDQFWFTAKSFGGSHPYS